MDAPVLDLSTYCAPKAQPIDFTFVPVDARVLNLSLDTIVTDGTNKGTLRDVLKVTVDDTQQAKLAINGAANIAVDDKVAPFDFEYDEESGKMGAGTAFLQDDEEGN